MKELIKHAAVKDIKGFVVLGKCHADCFYKGNELGLKMSNKALDQGFFTNKGRYVDRYAAAKIANRSMKLKVNKILCSEDIWYRRDFIYCQVRGYLRVEERGKMK